MIARVEVCLQACGDPVEVGRADFSLRRGGISTAFAYAPSYIERRDAFAIDPALPLRLAPFHVAGLPGAFRDSAPDRWGRRVVLKRHQERALTDGAPLRALDEVDYLLGASSSTRQGALVYRVPGEGSFLSAAPDVPPLVQLPRLLSASRRIVRDEAGHDEIKALLDAVIWLAISGHVLASRKKNPYHLR